MTDPAQRSSEASQRSVVLADRFVSLADTLVDDFDVVDLMDQLVATSVELLGIQAAGLLLLDPRGQLQLVASSSEKTRLIELFQIQSHQGPCLDCVSSGTVVTAENISESEDRWPEFAAAAAHLGFSSVYAVPMRLRDQVIGGLNLFCTTAPPLGEEDQRLAQAFADMATIGLLQQRTRHRATMLAEQLQRALNSRVSIEQAKGVLAEYAGIGVDVAFDRLRDFARDHNRKLSELAEAVVRRTVPLETVVRPRPR